MAMGGVYTQPQHGSLVMLSGLRESGDYSDLIVKCGSKIHRVHKAILCSRSDYFKVACKPDAFKVGPFRDCLCTLAQRFQEGRDHVINIPAAVSHRDTASGDHPNTIKAVIDFCYGLPSYDQNGPASVPALEWLAAMYVAADKYQVHDMKQNLIASFKRCLAGMKDSQPRKRVATDNHYGQIGNRTSPRFNFNPTPKDETFSRAPFACIPGVITLLYSNLPGEDRVMKEDVLKWLLNEKPSCLRTATMDNVLTSNPDFAADMARMLRDKYCPSEDDDTPENIHGRPVFLTPHHMTPWN
ncbi:hypothetical protein BDZ85DRAFT_320031 [Elsinoe ampelina]|uniref:BTB domain-containing protein n=1 Tax=Elsinoe ampelina TaxID=302913 RepID=A0A6A6G8K0_9PEZI|nr:hypothetical protein BDZ85DRAFT_320031 [Elsinoe ampelina]